MIEGINILSQTEVISDMEFNWLAFAVVFSVTAIISTVIAFDAFVSTSDRIWGLITAVFAGLLMGIIAGAASATPVSYETRYKVTVDDSVSMNEFLDTYEIIDTEGKLITVKEIK